jgi:enoyl-[acyl-carrier protein] reductase I
VGDDAQIERCSPTWATWPKFDGFVHSIGLRRARPSPATFWTACRARLPHRARHQRLQLSGMAKAALPYLNDKSRC